MSVLELVQRGGPIMIPLFAVSLIIWWVGFHLWFDLQRSARKTEARRRARHVLPVLKTLTTTAPYLGLLGTVGGMMMAFEGLIRFGPGNMRGLSGGIARALVTTQAGLMVALVGMLFLVFLEGRVRRIDAGLPATSTGRRSRRRRHA